MVMDQAAPPQSCNSSSNRKRCIRSDMVVSPLEEDETCPARTTKRRKVSTAQGVRFDLDQNQTQQIIEQEEDGSTASQELWFTADELKSIRLREAQVVQHHRSSDYFMKQVNLLLEYATDKKNKTPSSKKTLLVDSDEDLDSNSNNHRMSEDLLLLFTPHVAIASSEARGLERETNTAFRQHRKDTIQDLLKSQKALQQWRGGKDKSHQFSADFQQRALSEHYQRLSRPSVRMAKWLGQADADVLGGGQVDDDDADILLSFGHPQQQQYQQAYYDLDDLDMDTFEW